DYFSYNHDFAYFCLPPALKKTNQKPIPQSQWEYDNLRNWGKESQRATAKNCFYPIIVKDTTILDFGDVCSDSFHPGTCNRIRNDGTIEIYPVDSSGTERKWRYARDTVETINHLLKVHVTNTGEVQILKAKDSIQYKTVWDDAIYIAGDYGTRLLTEMGIFPEENLYPKSVYTVRDSIHAVSDDKSIVLDFFAGSGTTAHAVMDLNKEDDGKRKYILVEMANYFDTILIPRLKKLCYSFSWKGGKPQDGDGISQFFKYQVLEQYEDTLDNIELTPNKTAQSLFKDVYLLKYFLDYETRGDPSLLNMGMIKNPFDYKLRVNLEEVGEPQEMVVDIPETFNYLLGLTVKMLKTREQSDRSNLKKKVSIRPRGKRRKRYSYSMERI
ncbi:MAG: DNA methyltransferase, partial [Thermodesulfobacteriota bacterium]